MHPETDKIEAEGAEAEGKLRGGDLLDEGPPTPR